MSAAGAMQVGVAGVGRPAWAALFVCALSLGATLAIAVWAWRRRGGAAAAIPFAALALAQAIWNAGHLAELASSSLAAKVAWDSFETLPAVAVPFFLLLFAARYGRRRLPLALTVVVAAALAVPALVIVAAPLAGGLRAGAHLEPPYGALVYDFTSWDLAYIAAILAVALSACAMLLGQFLHQHPTFRAQTAGVAMAMLISVVGGFAWVALDLRLEGERDVSHVTFAVSSLVMAWTLSRGRLFDLVPVAREAILEQLTDAVLVIDRLGRVVDVNQVAATLLQSPPRSAIGRPLAEVLQRWPDVAAVAGGDEPCQEEVSSPSKLGQRWYDVRWAPLRDRSGRSLGGTLVLRDVTTLRQARLVLEQRLQEAQKLEAVGRVAAGVAHDFNNLLTVISASVDVARRELPAASPAHSLLDEAQQAVDSAAGVTRQLLTFSRKQATQPRRLVIAETVTAIEGVLRRLARPSTLAPARLPDDLWAVYMDPAQLQQVLMNLIVNARDAMPNGGEIAISGQNVTVPADPTSSRRGGDFVRLDVRDRGLGMSVEVQAQLFQPFFTTKPEGQGTGLGLAVVHGAVVGGGGFIEIESSPGAGTTVALFLPRAA